MKRPNYADNPVFDLSAKIEPTNDDRIINYLRNENAYLRGVIKAYEKVLKVKEQQ